MTVVGGVVLLGWVPAAAFLYFHGRAVVRAERKNWAGVAVLVMAIALFIAMSLALIRSFGIILPDWLRAAGYGVILIALWWKLITILRYEYGKRAPLVESTGARELEREDSR
jgi:predicted membrane-bound dolichyl-phosphate-mannose-protein mannosyltransferase